LLLLFSQFLPLSLCIFIQLPLFLHFSPQHLLPSSIPLLFLSLFSLSYPFCPPFRFLFTLPVHPTLLYFTFFSLPSSFSAFLFASSSSFYFVIVFFFRSLLFLLFLFPLIHHPFRFSSFLFSSPPSSFFLLLLLA
jgi:hypothetical protein